MAQKLVQTQTPSLGQTLTPQQLLQVHLLELPLRDFEQRVKDEILDNSALEEGNDEDQRDNDAPEGEDMGDEDNNESENAHDDALADYLTADDTPDYLLNTANGEEEKIPPCLSDNNNPCTKNSRHRFPNTTSPTNKNV